MCQQVGTVREGFGNDAIRVGYWELRGSLEYDREKSRDTDRRDAWVEGDEPAWGRGAWVFIQSVTSDWVMMSLLGKV